MTHAARPPAFVVQVRRSTRRRKTSEGRLVGGVLTVTVPSWMSAAQVDAAVEAMTEHFRRKQSTDRVELAERAAALARRHRLRQPTEIRWVDNMTARWGSCTPSTGVIRLSSRLAAFPDWVLDYVIVHELAHLHEPNHSPAFWQLVQRYPKAERAAGYLIAKAADGDDPDAWL